MKRRTRIGEKENIKGVGRQLLGRAWPSGQTSVSGHCSSAQTGGQWRVAERPKSQATLLVAAALKAKKPGLRLR
jgi:hypothetical protein